MALLPGRTIKIASQLGYLLLHGCSGNAYYYSMVQLKCMIVGQWKRVRMVLIAPSKSQSFYTITFPKQINLTNHDMVLKN